MQIFPFNNGQIIDALAQEYAIQQNETESFEVEPMPDHYLFEQLGDQEMEECNNSGQADN